MDNTTRTDQDTQHAPQVDPKAPAPQGDRAKTKPATPQVPPASGDVRNEGSINRRNEGL